VVEWSRALGIRLSDWYCSASMVYYTHIIYFSFLINFSVIKYYWYMVLVSIACDLGLKNGTVDFDQRHIGNGLIMEFQA
jgi:hypothetical protein